jgi:hypothetical protein
LIIQIGAYTVAFWLGMHLLSRDIHSPRLRWTGLGAISYALALAGGLLEPWTSGGTAGLVFAWSAHTFPYLPGLLWNGATVHLLPEEDPLRERLVIAWRWGQLPLVVILLLVGIVTSPVEGIQIRSPLGAALAIGTLLPLLATTLSLIRSSWTAGIQSRTIGVVLLATLFFTLGAGLSLGRWEWIPRPWLISAIGVDLLILGLAIGVLDALDQGERWGPEFLQAGVNALFFLALFGGPVALTMVFGAGVGLPMLALLLAIITAAILAQSLSDTIQTGLERLSLYAFPGLRRRRAQLRTESRVLPRVNPELAPEAIPEEEFTRLTRRALSHFGDLPRLAASPLTNLHVVSARLEQRGTPDHTLARATELKSLLTEAILNLKPQEEAEFGTTDSWRYFNALYFPYVQGLRPYSRRTVHSDLDESSRHALEWFRSQVPERTLYNWQTVAAALVARYLRDLSG